jgi:hypothetical protein
MHTGFWLENLKERPRYRCQSNIQIGLKEIGWEGVGLSIIRTFGFIKCVTFLD